jgi:hypothetical protein
LDQTGFANTEIVRQVGLASGPRNGMAEAVLVTKNFLDPHRFFQVKHGIPCFLGKSLDGTSFRNLAAPLRLIIGVYGFQIYWPHITVARDSNLLSAWQHKHVNCEPSRNVASYYPIRSNAPDTENHSAKLAVLVHGYIKVQDGSHCPFQLLLHQGGLGLNLVECIVHRSALTIRYSGIPEHPEQGEELNSKRKPFTAFLAFLFGLPLLWWGMGWWKGLYLNPDGIRGYILASSG